MSPTNLGQICVRPRHGSSPDPIRAAVRPRRDTPSSPWTHGVRRQGQRAAESTRAAGPVVDSAGHRHRARRVEVERPSMRSRPVHVVRSVGGANGPTSSGREAGGDRALATWRASRRIGRKTDPRVPRRSGGVVRGRGQQDGRRNLCFANSEPDADHLVRIVAAALLPGRRESVPGPAVPARGTRSRCSGALLVRSHRHSASQFSKPYRAEADATIRRTKHAMGCHASSTTRPLHRRVMGLVAGGIVHQSPFRGSSAGRAFDC